MQDLLKKAFGKKPEAVADVADQVAQLQSELQTAMDMVGQVEEQLLEKTSLLEAALGKLAEFEAVANAAKAEAEAAAALAAEMKLEQRKAALGNVIGSDNPQFDVIFGAIANIILMNNVYNGGQRIKAYELMTKYGGKWMMTIDADIEITDENFMPQIIDLSNIDKEFMVLSDDAKYSLIPLDARITKSEACLAKGIPLKFGALLEGAYGWIVLI